jgi:hypothetical protein
MANNQLLLNEVQAKFGLPAIHYDASQLEAALAAVINQMILHQYDRLIQLLYRMDIDEKKLKTLLQDHPKTDAGRIMAALVIEREQQKIASREANKFKGNEAEDVEGTERW